MPKHLPHIILVLFLCLTTWTASAEDIILRTSNGQILKGTIVFQNDEVIVLSATDGSRYQYQRSEVEVLDESDLPKEEKEEEKSHGERKVAVQIHLNGGGAVIPHSGWGGMAGAQLSIGAKRVAGKRVFLGGGIGYEVMFYKKQLLSFLPIAVVAQVPLTDKKSAPYLGASMGYGVALGKSYSGGLYACANAGWRWETKNDKAVLLGIDVTFQQTRINITETIDEQTFANHTGRCITQIRGRLIIEI